MTNRLNYRQGLLTILLGMLMFTIGCSRPKVISISDQEAHMKRIASLYMGYRSAKNASPKNTADLKQWVKSLKADQLERYQVTDVEQALRSPRDGEEVMVVPIPKNAMMGMSKVIAYEKVGQNGKHWVLNSQAYLSEATTAELDQMLKEIGAKR